MKKIVSALLLFSFILSLAACSSKETSSVDFSMTTYLEPTSGVTITYPDCFSEKKETVDGITFYTEDKDAKFMIYVTHNSNLNVADYLSQSNDDSSTIKNQTEDSFDQDLRDSDYSYAVTAFTTDYIIIAGIEYMDTAKNLYYSLCNELYIEVPDDKKVVANTNGSESNSLDESTTDSADNTINDSTEIFTDYLPITKELIDTVLNYDVFDWGLAEEEDKIRMATEIISVFAQVDGPIDKNPEALVAELEQLIYQEDQQNIFEVACSIYEFDLSNYQQLPKTLEADGENSNNSSNDSNNADDSDNTADDANNTVGEPTPQLLSQVLLYDIFDWQLADDAGKIVITSDMIQVLTYYELLWYNTSLAMNPQDFVDFIDSDLGYIGQDSLFNAVCSKLGFDIQPYNDLNNNQ